jgi:hypothetical protein
MRDVSHHTDCIENKHRKTLIIWISNCKIAPSGVEGFLKKHPDNFTGMFLIAIVDFRPT